MAAVQALIHIGDQLRDAIQDMNASSSASAGAQSDAMAAAVTVLNNQLQALTNIERRVADLQGEADISAALN